MNHTMKLLTSPYERVASGKKKIEIRLNEEKWNKIDIGDKITFVKEPKLKETITAEVKDLLIYASFSELINDFGIEYFGHNSIYSIENYLEDIHKIYSPEKEKVYGVLAIKIELITY